MLVPPGKENVVIDPFCGSGTTLVAAQKHGVSYLGIDIDENCVEQSRTRIEQASDLFSLEKEFALHGEK
jgi:site-specific DNA-methyltransferase (adenine-specific)